MTRSGGYSDATRDRQLQEDRARREADAANRGLRQVYAAAEQQQAAAPGMQQPPHEEVPHSDSDGDEHEFHEASEDADGAAGAGGDGNLPPNVNLPAQAVMVAFEDENGKDTADIFKTVGQIKLAWTENEVPFWFRQLETKMKFMGVRSQWLKLQVLTNVLPADKLMLIKYLVDIDEADCGDTQYKQAKQRLLQLFGPKEGDQYMKAAGLVMSSTPSDLARQLIALICKGRQPMNGCHCEETVSGMWRLKLPDEVRIAVAPLSLEAPTMEATLTTADAIYKAMNPNTIASIKQAGAPASDPQLAAFNQRGRGGINSNQGAAPGGAGRGRGTRKPKSADNPPKGVCKTHYEHGKSAYNCLNPFQCPWANFIVQRPTKNKGQNANTQQGKNA